MTKAYTPALGAGRYADVSDDENMYAHVIDQHADEIDARNLIITAEWWLTRMSEQISYAEADRIASCLSRCMRELDRAARGQRIATTAIITALSNLQQSATKDASE